LIKEAHSNGLIRGVKVSEVEAMSHLLFMDDIFVSVVVSLRDLASLKNSLTLFIQATRMTVNPEKSCLIINHCSEAETHSLLNIIPVQQKTLGEGMKYLGFYLKPDFYRKEDWSWLIRKVEAKILIWVNHLLSRGGRLVLIKVVMENIPVCWNSIATLPKGVLDKI
jgi:hypothetical protein